MKKTEKTFKIKKLTDKEIARREKANREMREPVNGLTFDLVGYLTNGRKG